MAINWAFLRYDHSVIISDLYWLKDGESLAISEVVEVTCDPATVVQPSPGEGAMYEVRRGCVSFDIYTLTNTGPDDVVGFSFSTIGASDKERNVSVLKHGFGLATACSLGDIQPETPIKCCSIGQVQDLNRPGLTILEVANFKIAKSVTLIPANRQGVIFKAD